MDDATIEFVLKDPVVLGGVAAGVVAVTAFLSWVLLGGGGQKKIATATPIANDKDGTDGGGTDVSKASTKKKKKKKKVSSTATEPDSKEEAKVENEDDEDEDEAEKKEDTMQNTNATTVGSKKKKKKKKGDSATTNVEAKEVSVPEPEPSVPESTAMEESSAVNTKKTKKKKKKKGGVAETTNVEKNLQPENNDPNKTSNKPDDDDDDDEEDDALLLSTFAKGSRQVKKDKKKEETPAADNGGWNTIGKKNKSSPETAVNSEVTGSAKGTTVTSEGDNQNEAEATPIVDENAPISHFVPLQDSDIPILIGKQGATISALQQELKVRLDVTKPSGTDGASTGDSATTGVTIYGSTALVQTAQEQIELLIATEKSKTAHSRTLSGREVSIGNSSSNGIKAIIGRGGSVIQNIQSVSNCKLDANIEAGTVNIVGASEEAVELAVNMCMQAVHGESQSTVDLKTRNMVMMVCGKGLTNLKQWQEETGCRFDFAERGSTVLNISGDTDKIARALALVTERMTLCKGTSITVEADKIGAVYGKGGETLRQIQESTGTNVEILQTSPGEPASCQIVGEPDAVAKARDMIQKAMDGDVVELKPGQVIEKLDLGVAVSAVIGRGGSKLQELERKHSCQITIGRGTSAATIVGMPEKVKECKSDIESIVLPLNKKAEAEAKIKAEAEKLAQQKEGNAWASVDETLDGW